MNKLFLLSVILFSSLIASSQGIVIDENFDDWMSNDVTLVQDVENDNISSSYDLLSLGVASDERFLYVSFKLDRLVNLQSNNSIQLQIDTDNNYETGIKENGIGVDLTYEFGNREGRIIFNNNSYNITHIDLGLIVLPTVTSDQFELMIDRNKLINGNPLFSGNDIRLMLVNDKTNGDVIPNTSGGVLYTLNTVGISTPTYSFERPGNTDLRILSYNVLQDDMFEDNKEESYSNILSLINPDIIGFQEIYNHSAKETKEAVEQFLGTTSNQWYYSLSNPDIICVSKYPIVNQVALDGNAAFWIKKDGKDLIFINAHLPCCDNNAGRQDEVDNIMSFVRSIKDGNNSWNLDPYVPIIIVGDMNLVGDVQQRTTFLEGDIVGEIEFGDDFNPDWDNSNLEDVKAISTGVPVTMTWYDEYSSYNPGRLDYVIYTGSVMEKLNAFSLFTPGMSQDSLNKYQLSYDDSTWASDHLPLTVDFRMKEFVSTKDAEIKTSITISPNPASNLVSVDFSSSQAFISSVLIIDNHGRKMKSISVEKNIKETSIDISDINDGLYSIIFYDINNKLIGAEKLVVVRK